MTTKRLQESDPMLPEDYFKLDSVQVGTNSQGHKVESSRYRNLTRREPPKPTDIMVFGDGRPDPRISVVVTYNIETQHYTLKFSGSADPQTEDPPSIVYITLTMTPSYGLYYTTNTYVEQYSHAKNRVIQVKTTMEDASKRCWTVRHFANGLCYDLWLTHKQRVVKYLYEPSRVKRLCERYLLNDGDGDNDVSVYDPSELDKYINDPYKLLTSTSYVDSLIDRFIKTMFHDDKFFSNEKIKRLQDRIKNK